MKLFSHENKLGHTTFIVLVDTHDKIGTFVECPDAILEVVDINVY